MPVISLMMLAAHPVPLASDDSVPRIVISGTGVVTTSPDAATIAYRIIGEGATSDVAVRAMVAKRARISAQLATIDPASQPKSSEVSITEVRGDDCKHDDDDTARLSTGKCAVVGYIATMDATLRTTAVKDAGTIVSLLGRLGASRPHIESFDLVDPKAADRRAVAAALLDARRQADAIAAGTGVILGHMLVATTGAQPEPEQDIIVTGSHPPPPPVVEAPIAVDLTPKPITSRAQVTVTYAVTP